MLSEPAPSSLSRLEELVLDANIVTVHLGFERACRNVRAWLRVEVEKAQRAAAEKGAPVEVDCRDCGEPLAMSRSYAEKVIRGAVEQPRCIDCSRSPAQTAEAEAIASRFVEDLGEQAVELAGAVTALR